MRRAKNANRHPLAGIGVVLALLSWGLLFLATPLYLEIGGWGRAPFLFLGVLALLFSLLGALVELSNLLGKRPFGEMAPAIMLAFIPFEQQKNSLTPFLIASQPPLKMRRTLKSAPHSILLSL